jgi:hypothetical protein
MDNTMMNVRGAIISVIVAIAVVLPDAARLHAECIVPPPPCAALDRSGYVFVADVIEAMSELEMSESHSARFVPERVRFRIVEAFKSPDFVDIF